MPVTSASVFPYTPGFIHSEQFAFTVQVNRFQDQTEQRYLVSRERGLQISYEFPYPSSALIAGVRSWFMDTNGPQQPFTIVDHRDRSTYMARFASNNLDTFRGPHIVRALKIDFVTLTGGTAPLSTSYTATSYANFCEDVVPNSGTVSPPPANPFSGAIAGSGQTLIAYPGGDWSFWRATSSTLFPSYYMTGDAGGGVLNAALTAVNGTLYAAPFICTRSGAVVGEVGIWVNQSAPAAAFTHLGIYTQRSSSTVNLYPGNRLVDVGTISLQTSGYVSLSTSFQMRDDTLYFGTYVASGAESIMKAPNPIVLGRDSGATPTYGWQVNNFNAFSAPSTFPDSAVQALAIHALFLRFTG